MIARAGLFAASLAIACGGTPATEPSAPTPLSPVARPAQSIAHGGITFDLDPRIAAGAAAAEVAACPLGSPTDKPDGVAPAHVAFRFGSAHPVEPTRACSVPDFETAGLYVFAAADWSSTFKGADKEIDALRQLLAARQLAPGAQVPFVPFVDASFAIAERVTFLDFTGGSGVLFLGELSIEPSSLGQDLAFVFQGLTSDGAHYVLAIFPATTTVSVPPFGADPKAPYDAQVAQFAPYRADVAHMLASAADDQLTPSPARLRPMLESLSIPATLEK